MQPQRCPQKIREHPPQRRIPRQIRPPQIGALEDLLWLIGGVLVMKPAQRIPSQSQTRQARHHDALIEPVGPREARRTPHLDQVRSAWGTPRSSASHLLATESLAAAWQLLIRPVRSRAQGEREAPARPRVDG